MKRHTFPLMFAVGSLLLGFAGSAGAGAQHCLDASGKVTLSDRPCRAVVPKAASGTAGHTRKAVVVRHSPTTQGLERDQETLKAARAATLLGAAAARQPRLAGLD